MYRIMVKLYPQKLHRYRLVKKLTKEILKSCFRANLNGNNFIENIINLGNIGDKVM